MDRRRLLLVVAAVIAVLGVALVFVYAHGADARAAKKYDTVQVLTASQKISPGESFDDAFEAGKFQLTYVARNQLLSGASKTSDSFQDKVALTTIYPHEQLIPTKFGGADEVQAAATLPIPAGKLAISVLVKDDGRVGTFLRAGAQVSIIFTKLAPDQKPILSRTLLDRVTVLAMGTRTTVPSSSGAGQNDNSDTEIQQLLTLGVTQRQAEQIRFAEKDGELSAALLNDASKVTADKGVTANDVVK